MKSLTKEQQESYEYRKVCYICKEKFENKYLKDKHYRKVRDYCAGEYRCVYVIKNIAYLKIFLLLFIMDLTMIIILSSNS